MSKLQVQGNASGTGIVTLAAPNTNSNITLTLPAAAGTVLTTATSGVPIGGPAFSAYTGGNQSLTSLVSTKLAINTEIFDTNSNYDPTNYRFTPNVAGYYQLSVSVGIASNATSYFMDVSIFQNGSQYLGQPLFGGGGNGTAFYRGSGAIVVYANGTTDYFEIYGLCSQTQNTASCFFSGALIRSAT